MSTATARVGAALLVLVVAGCGGGTDAAAPSRVAVVDAFTTEGTHALAVYLELANDGGPDEIVGGALLGDDADLAERVSLHRRGERDGLATMEPVDALAVPGTGEGALVPADAHLMLEGVGAAVEAGSTLRLHLELRQGADLEVDVRVVTADEAVELVLGEAS